MAEVFAGIGLAAAIAGLIDFIKPVTNQLGPTAYGKQDLTRLVGELIDLQISYENLKSFIESSNNQQPSLLMCLEEPQRQCVEVLTMLRKRLDNQSFVDRRIRGAKWDKNFDKCMKILDQTRVSFDLVFQVDRYKTSSTALTNLKNHIEASTNYFQSISTALDLNAEKIAEIADQSIEHHAEAREWHGEQVGNHKRVAVEITTWKDESQTKEEEILRNEIMRWLCNTDPGTNQDSAVRKREPTTGSWCGKTILCSSIIAATQQYCKGIPNAAVAYFYFSFTDAKKQNVSNFIRSILGQFVCQREKTPEILKDLYKTHRHITPSLKYLLSGFDALLLLPGENFIIVDALNECPTQDSEMDELCEHLKYLASSKKLHILATGRKEADLEDGLDGSEGLITVPIRTSCVDADIRLYIESELDNNLRFRRKKWLSKVRGDIVQTLEKKSQGMFRWAFCQLETIKNSCHNIKDVHTTLKSLPENLDDTYKRILEGISNHHKQKVIRALQWLAFSWYPLTIDELAEAVIVNTAQTPACKVADRFEDPLDIMKMLSSLVVTQTWSPSSSWSYPNFSKFPFMVGEAPYAGSLILLAHFSIKEYLLSDRITISAPEFALKRELGDQLLLESCLWHIVFVLDLLAEERNSSDSAKNHQPTGPNEVLYIGDVSEGVNKSPEPEEFGGADRESDASHSLASTHLY